MTLQLTPVWPELVTWVHPMGPRTTINVHPEDEEADIFNIWHHWPSDQYNALSLILKADTEIWETEQNGKLGSSGYLVSKSERRYK